MPTFATLIYYLEGINTFLGLFLNVLLLYAIRTFSRAHLGAYKHLLTIFTLVDLLLVILHVLLNPRVVRAGNTHGTVTDTMFDDMRITALYIGCQSVPFTLLGIHFLYRYWSVLLPHLIRMFSQKAFVVFLASLAHGVLISWYFLSMFSGSGHDISAARIDIMIEYERKYGKAIENAWIIFDHWRDNNFDAVLFMMIIFMNVIMIMSVVAAASFAILTFHHIRNSKKMSMQTIELQRKLLLALCAQAAVPSLFVYLPYLACIDLPFLRIPGSIFHDICAPCFTFFPVWDAAIIIALIADYRTGLMRMVWKRKQPTAQTTVYVSSVVPSRNTPL